MRAWDETEEVLRRQAERRAEEQAETLDELAEHGVDLDPAVRRGAGGEPAGESASELEGAARPAPATHRHGDLEHASDHVHPHAHSGPGEKPVVGIVGAGAVGTALGVALSRAGWPVGAVASRDPARRTRFGELVPGVRAFAEPTALIDDVELVILAVPDDVVEPLARGLRLYAGQAIVHTSGLLGAEVLEPAMAAGTQAGAFHPLVAFADLDRALEALHGATIAIEGDDELAAHLGDMAEAIGATPVRLAPGSKAAYHAAAVLSAGGLVALLDTIREVAAAVGLDEAGALEIYLPLLEQTVANARTLGIDRALTGPATRGDAGTIAAHRAAIAADAPAAMDVYRALLTRDVAIAERRGALSPEASERLRTALAPDP
ncbi:MAG TPA: DUF2520 domain-containing protein [Candidatus Limnocylindrales bacterium]|nr:DUF2520 domain-containing protein [Candidatus Limnocylindrales bacterium]